MLHLCQYTKVVTFLLVFNLVIMIAYISHRSKIDTPRYAPGKRARPHPRHGPRMWRLPPTARLLTSTEDAVRKTDFSGSPMAPWWETDLSAPTKATERKTDPSTSGNSPEAKNDLSASTKIPELSSYSSTSANDPERKSDTSAFMKTPELMSDSSTSAKAPERKSDDFAILDTCPLKVIDPLSPELKQFHTPGFNPKQVSDIIC
ncbi:hypothetical protein Y032_0051g2068 [Ancylostoma ceylanicum]|uniref:Uncharacterized protein n=2 Tax=Ancylostoma ceylanicum TaxID=53326 RepID=A0A016U7P5_9BILA|nr:hypothetical protein Y032_0051g2068 [Ancylostoma ceylanicum]